MESIRGHAMHHSTYYKLLLLDGSVIFPHFFSHEVLLDKVGY